MSVHPSRSSVWDYNYAERRSQKRQGKCKLCSKVLTFNGSTTTNLWNHVRTAHDRELSGTSESDKKVKLETNVKPPPPGSVASFFSKSSCSDARSRQITDLLAMWCARNVRPMSIIEDSGLKDVFKFVEPGYSMPSHPHVTNNLKRKFDVVLEKVKDLLADVDAVSFTTDIWTSHATQGYMSLTAHFLRDWSMVSLCLGTVSFPERHTADNIVDKFAELTAEFNIQPSAQGALVHDQASNTEVAGRRLEVDLPNFSSVTCAAHRLQNTIKRGLETATVSKLLASARHCVSHFKRSVVAMEGIRHHQQQTGDKQLKFVQEVATSWNSSLHMLERLILLYTHFCCVYHGWLSPISSRFGCHRKP